MIDNRSNFRIDIVGGPVGDLRLDDVLELGRIAVVRGVEDALEDRYAAKYDNAITKLTVHENRKRFGAAPKQSYGSPRAIV